MAERSPSMGSLVMLVERAPALLRPGEKRLSGLRRVGDDPVGGRLAAEADAGPEQVDRRPRGQLAAGALPRLEHRLALGGADSLGDQRTLAVEAGRLVALVGVREDIDHGLGFGHPPGAAHLRLEGAVRVARVVLGIDLVLGGDDRAVVGERRPGADGCARVVGLDPIDAQDAHQRVDRVRVAERILIDAALPDLLDHPVVGEMRLEAAVLR